MPMFRYVAAERNGGLRKGRLEATSKLAALQAVQAQGLILMELEEVLANPDLPTRTMKKAAAKVETIGEPHPATRWPSPMRAAFLRQLSTMFEAGIAIDHAVKALADGETIYAVVGQRLDEMSRLLAVGHPLSKSMHQSGLFSTLQVGTVYVGETSGTLGRMLDNLATLEEKDVEVQRALMAKMSYPFGVMIAMLCALAILGNLMARVMQSLPALESSRQGLLGMVALVVSSRWLFAALLLTPVALAALLWHAWRKPRGRELMEAAVLSVPRLGTVLRKLEAARVCRLLGTLTHCGLRVDRALKLARAATSSPCARQALGRAADTLSAGSSVAVALERADFFPREVIQLTAVGEESGKLPLLLRKVAEYAEYEVERFLEAATALLEPLLMSVLGLAVGLIILATFAPIYESLKTL